MGNDSSSGKREPAEAARGRRGTDPSSVDRRVRAHTTRFALKLEYTYSIARLAFLSALVFRLIWQWELYGTRHGAFSLSAYVVVILFSLYPIVARERLEAQTKMLLPFSVALDATIAFLALLPNALWPPVGHPGIIHTIEPAGLLVAAMAAGIRLSPRVALFGGALNGVFFAVLLGVEAAYSSVSPVDPIPRIVLFGIFLLAAMTLAYIVALRTRSLAVEAALDAIRLERSRRSIESLLRDHHDLRTVLTSATLRAELLEHTLRGEEAPAEGYHGQLLTGLRSDLKRMRTFFNDIKERTFRELFQPDNLEQVQLSRTSREALEELRSRFPEVTMDLRAEASARGARLCGGAESLHRILVNLITNACEGDGQSGATCVEVIVSEVRDKGRVRLTVQDDGPGFRSSLLGQPIGEAMITTKPGGAGLGLMLIARLIEASGGKLDHGNRDSGGGYVTVELPAAAAA